MQRKGIAYVWLIIAALVAVWVGTAVFAQRGQDGPAGPGGPGMRGPMGPAPIMKAGTQGLFVLLGGTLTKYDAALKEQGSLKLLQPPAGNPPADGEQRPPMPPRGILLLAPATQGASEKVIAVFGDQIFSVDAATLKVAATAKLPAVDLPKPPDATGEDQQAPPPMRQAPAPLAFELQGRILYIMRGPQIVGINVDDGTVAGSATLPKPQPPAGT